MSMSFSSISLPRAAESWKTSSFSALLTLLIGVILSCLLFLQMHRHEQALEDANFERHANAHVVAFQVGVENAIQGLEAIDRSFNTFGAVSEKQFQKLTRPILAHYPYIQNFTYQQLVTRAERPAFEAGMRARHPGFSITDIVNGKAVAAAGRDSYRVITAVEPIAGNEMLFGLDVAAYTSRQDAAIRRATDTGAASASALFRTLEDKGSELAFVVLMPVYQADAITEDVASRRHATVGYTVALFRATDLVEKILNTAGLLHVSADVSVYGSAASNELDLVYRKGQAPYQGDNQSIVPEWVFRDRPKTLSRTFDIGGTPWHMDVSAPPQPFASTHLGSLFALLVGVFASFLAAAYVRMLVLRSHRVQTIVEERTAELKIINERLNEDIAFRRRIEETLRHTEYVLTKAQEVAHLGSWEFDVATGNLECSDEFFRICGIAPQSIKPTLEFILGIAHPDDRDAAKGAIDLALSQGSEYRIEKRIVRPDGSIRHVIGRGEMTLSENGELQKVVGSFLDITEQKQTEIALRESQEKLRDLAAHLERVREDERKRIAREVHDELGSLLTGIKAYLSMALDGAQNDRARSVKLLADTMNLVDTATETVRRVITDLRPSVLDHLGVWMALEWYAGVFAERAGLICVCAIEENAAATELDPERGIMVFRIVQEALNNVVRHAGASKVEIRARCQEDLVIVEIEDDGKGMDTARLGERQSWGIIGMHERVRHFGGRLNITGMLGKGTHIALRFPLHN